MRTSLIWFVVACSTPTVEVSHFEASFDLLDDRGVAGDAVAIGEDLGLTARGLERDTPYRIVVTDEREGHELFAIAVSSDRDGAIERSLVMPDLGLGDDRDDPWFATRDVGRASEYLADRKLRVSIEAGGEPVRSRVIEVIASGRKPQVLLFDERGVTRDAEVKDPFRVVGRRLPPGKATVLLTADRHEWRTGDKIEPATSRDGAPLAWRVTIDERGELDHAIALDRVTPGPYQVAVYPSHDKQLPPLDHRWILAKPLAPALNVLDPNFELPYWNGAAMRIADLSARAGVHADLFGVGEPVGAVYLAPQNILAPAPQLSLGRKARVYTIAHRELDEWRTNPPLVDAGGRVVEAMLTLAGTAGHVAIGDFPLGRYDIVIDTGNRATTPSRFVADGRFDVDHDIVDGVTRTGFTVARDPAAPGTFAVGETSYTLPDLPLRMTSSPFELTVRMVGEVRYPATTSGPNAPIAPGAFPIVIVATGVLLDHRGYDGLLAHLAAHGYIAVAVESSEPQLITAGNDIDLRAEMVMHHLAALVDPARAPSAIAGHVDANNVSLVGHSRGGDAALRVAHIARRDSLPLALRAIVAIAPTDLTGVARHSYADASIAGVPYLALHGTADSDVGTGEGFPFADATNGTAFRAFERLFGPRAIVFVRHACHDLFNSRKAACELPYVQANHAPPTITALSAPEHQHLLRGYTLAFLDRHARGDTLMDVYVAEAGLPGTVAEVRHDLAGPGRVLLSGPSRAQGAELLADSLWRLDLNSPYRDQGLLVRTGATGGELHIATSPIDASQMVDPVVSLRVGQPVGMLGRIRAAGLTFLDQLDAGTSPPGFRPWLMLWDTSEPTPQARIVTEIAGTRWLLEDGDRRRVRITKQTVPVGPGVFALSLKDPAFAEHHSATPIWVRVTDLAGRSRAIRTVVEPSWVPEMITDDPLWHVDLRTLSALTAVRIPLSAFALPDFAGDGIDPRRIAEVTIEIEGESELLIADVAIAPGR